MNIYLKVKICSLAAEARIIRKQMRRVAARPYSKTKSTPMESLQSAAKDLHEVGVIDKATKNRFDFAGIPPKSRERILKRLRNRQPGKQHPAWLGMQHHRKVVVRKEARCSCLAYGFLRGRTYDQLEHSCHEKPDWKKVEDIVARFAEEDKRVVQQKFEQWKQSAGE